MGQSNVIRDTKVFQGTATNGGGTFTATVVTSAAPYTDRIVRMKATAYLSAASASHLTKVASLVAEYVVANRNNTTTAVTALATSANPDDSTGLLTSRPEVADTEMNTSTAAWTLSSSNAVLTVTNNGTGSVDANVTVVVDIESVGST